MNRRMLIAASVVVLHVFVLWALQSGLMHRAVEVIIPGEILSDIISPPAPQQTRQSQAPTPPRKLEPQPPKPQAQPVQAQQTVPPEPSPLVAPAAPAAAAPAAIEASTVAATPAALPAPTRIELPSSDATYLNNPRPAYPALSRRLGEQGKVVVRVLIGIDGKAEQVEIRRSSGYDRLDQSALATVRSWRYAPGKRNGIPEAMWFEVPIIYLLE
ncbi:MAG: energy transducer TonB [Burkholderiales bacterium]|nr:energy transducer TonB [Burkholderiales bacterium]